MQRFKIILASLAVVGAAVPAIAEAAPQARWASINQRQANLDRRIDQGVRSGALNRAEAARLRNDYRQLNRLESQYRRSGGGLSAGERRDLDRRFDQLSRRIQAEKNDRQGRPHRR